MPELETDEQNLELVAPALIGDETDSAAPVSEVDKTNAAFYKKFPYPWPPMKFEFLLDPHFETTMLNQAIGDWGDSVVPKRPRVWVAGCGTNLAVYTCLKFPEAAVLGSDLSTTSLSMCADTARQLGVSNLELREETINEVAYREQFDLIVCTGVIHHNARPEVTLGRLSAALKPEGVLEVMVYNRYHFIVPAALQKAIRMLAGGPSPQPDMELELAIAKALCRRFPLDNAVSNYLARVRNSPDSMLADLITQPVLYSYTVESLAALADSCGLELAAPYLDAMDKAQGRISWDMEFDDPDLRARYDALPDERRWHISNLLMHEKSPMLWFYLRRKDRAGRRKSEREVCEEFLDTRFVRTGTTQRFYLRDGEGKYRLSPDSVPYPVAAPPPAVRELVNSIDPAVPVRETFKRLGLETSFHVVNRARLMTTTSAFPYLRAVPPEKKSGPQGARARAEANYQRLRNIKPKGVSLGGEAPESRRESLGGDQLKEAAGQLAQQILAKIGERQGGVPTFCDNSLLALVKRLRQLDPELPWEESIGRFGGPEGEELGRALERLRLYLERRRRGRFVDFAERLSAEGGGALGASEIGNYELIMSQGVGECMHWKGRPLFKSVFDFSLYSMLLWDLKPRTIIEIGSGAGASAVWMADLSKSFGTECRVYSVDVVRPAASHDGVSFIEGDCNAVEKIFADDFLRDAPHPWLLIEDAHANVLGVLRHFHPHLARGDYLVIEDSPGKRAEIEAFFGEFPGGYKVDTHYTDFFGRNATCSRDSILVRQ
jgi:cephalosporin hydroxylase/SAM-dependent methyltransferase